MEFTYGAYGDLLALLDRQGYQVATYHDWQAYPRCVILRHDIDNSPEQALALARLQSKQALQQNWADFELLARKEDVSVEENVLHYRVVYTITADICK